MNLDLGDTRLLIDECKKQGLLRNQAAYVLATAYHETAHTMKPIAEMGGITYLKGKDYWPYYGRGYVQLTWDYNYQKAGKFLNQDFIKHPALLLQPRFAAPIIVRGMKEGWFTGKKLSTYITLQKSDFKGARHIVNGTDKAAQIAFYADDYDKLLEANGYEADAPAAPSVPETVTPVPSGGLFARFLTALGFKPAPKEKKK